MTTLHKQLFSVFAAGVLLLNAAAPAVAATTIEVTGNGAESNNTADVFVNTNRTVQQKNDAKVNNNINVNADTGNNDANNNTGGDVNVRTGNSASETTVSNTLNRNSAELDCCDGGDTEVTIEGNGYRSDNYVELDRINNTNIVQDNRADVRNNVDVNQNTGRNDANNNTGGDINIRTGKAEALVDVSTTANVNSARIGRNGDTGGTLSARIANNGAETDNDIDLFSLKENFVWQDNDADVDNDIDVRQTTGENDANNNTGGEVNVETGDTLGIALVDTMVNFNFADADCGCLLDVSAKIAGNGYKSDNLIFAEFLDNLGVYQGGQGLGNNADIDNDVDVDGKTGKNDVNNNTGEADGDPSVTTGDADSLVEVENSGNVNVYGDSDFEFPDFDFGNVDFDFDMAAFWSFWGFFS